MDCRRLKAGRPGATASKELLDCRGAQSLGIVAQDAMEGSAFPVIGKESHGVILAVHARLGLSDNLDRMISHKAGVEFVAGVEVDHPFDDGMLRLDKFNVNWAVRIVLALAWPRIGAKPDAPRQVFKLGPFIMPGATSEMDQRQSSAVFNELAQVLARSCIGPRLLPILEMQNDQVVILNGR